MAAGMAGHSQFQQPQGPGGYPQAMQQQRMQQHISIQGGSMGQMAQMGQLNQMGQPGLGADGTPNIQQALQQRILQQQQMKQQIGSPGQPNPMSPQQHMLSGQPQASHLPGQQIATSLSSQVRSPAPVQSPRPQSQPPHSSPSPRIQPQPSPHHVSPQTGSPHPGLAVTMASSMDQGHLGNPEQSAMLPQLNTPNRSALSNELSLTSRLKAEEKKNIDKLPAGRPPRDGTAPVVGRFSICELSEGGAGRWDGLRAHSARSRSPGHADVEIVALFSLIKNWF